MEKRNVDFLEKLRRRTAQAAIGSSALRNQGAPLVIAAARQAAEELDLSRYSLATDGTIDRLLDEDTAALLRSFPPPARNWGAARKGLNLFLRDVVYNVDLSAAFSLSNVRVLLEVPLDKDVATGLRGEDEGLSLPRWSTIKNLDDTVSSQYQAVAARVAERFNVDRVDLDVFFWRPRSRSVA